MLLKPTSDQRAACARAAELVNHQAEGLRLTGSQTTEAALRAYAATLKRIAGASEIEIADNERLHVENASFVLEGIRDGLLTAEFRERAAIVNQDISALNEIVSEYNASP